MSEENVLEMNGVYKSFKSVKVLENVDFSLKKGEVHALLGGNGAGKSTLMKILTGVYKKDKGEIYLDGNPVDIDSTDDSERLGISMIFQEFSLIPSLTVAQNIFLNREYKKGKYFIDNQKCIEKSKEILASLDVDIDPNTTVDSLGVGYWQVVEIAKSLSKNAKILIMDEPTSSLSANETETLFNMVRQLKEKGISIIYISHRMSEVFEICDKVTVLKDGRDVYTERCENATMEKIVENMLGKTVKNSFVWHERKYDRPKEPVLKVEQLSYGSIVNNVSFEVYPGEIVGLAGLMGSGRTEIVESIFGVRKKKSGNVLVKGKIIESTHQAIKSGLSLVPEDRRKQGLILSHSLRNNLMLPSINQLVKGLFVNDRRGDKLVNDYIDKLNIKTDSPNKISEQLSGGNQQKIVLAKWLARNPEVLILDEPTIGIDIGSKTEILENIRSLADSNMAVLVISSELEELLAISDRLLVIYKGEIIKEMYRNEIKSEEVLHHAIQAF
ncbi:sugar ABC transporter ATP-binding protein [Radiobacillus sp. PE A8.2]|uniref:sugar ABC transporter ATP-binding protein n=1 Tax=Radiobacillus sp. PE A8.2 TaxID=3380349 RepID=UPI00388E2256